MENLISKKISDKKCEKVVGGYPGLALLAKIDTGRTQLVTTSRTHAHSGYVEGYYTAHSSGNATTVTTTEVVPIYNYIYEDEKIYRKAGIIFCGNIFSRDEYFDLNTGAKLSKGFAQEKARKYLHSVYGNAMV